MYIELLKKMFQEMVVKKDCSKIAEYYHPDFQLVTNEQTMDYKEMVSSHEEIYATSIEYKIDYDEETLLEQRERVAGRIWITTKRDGEKPVKIEVMLIAQYKEKKLYRVWELTFPDWSKLPAFEEVEW